MNKTLIVIAALSLMGGLVLGGVVHELMFPQEATVGETLELTAYLDGELWPNGTLIDWETVEKNTTYYFPLTVNNTGTVNCTVIFTLENFPVDWTQTWTQNNTFCVIGESLIGNLTLTTPAIVANGTYKWNSYIKGIPT